MSLFRLRLFWGKPWLMVAGLAFFGLFLKVDLPGRANSAQTQSIWYYLRDRRPISSEERPIDVLLVGDIMLGRGVSNVQSPFRFVEQELKRADLAVGNFEGVFATRNEIKRFSQANSNSSKIHLLVPESRVMDLKTAGYDLLSLSNNHSLDLGSKGLARTVEVVKEAGIGVVGSGQDQTEAYKPYIASVRDVKIAFLAFNAISEPANSNGIPGKTGSQIAFWDWDRVFSAIQDASNTADAVIILVHWGDEYEQHAGLLQTEAAQKMYKAGADVIIGSHPHTIQETAVLQGTTNHRKNGFVAHSLGNFVFDQYHEATNLGLALHVYVDKAGLRAVKPILVRSGSTPKIVTDNEDGEILTRYKPASELIAYICTQSTCYQSSVEQETRESLFTTGRADLTGDGMDELIWLKNQRISIYEKSKLVWQSPPEWKVLDAAVGDPNLDGRMEIALALLKKDENGVTRSHPFLIGYRGGIYRQVWGGSAVPDQILEIEVADIDGDRDQELIVIQQNSNTGERYLSVWRYYNWYFHPVWRSSTDQYEGLFIVEPSQTGKPKIMAGRPW